MRNLFLTRVDSNQVAIAIRAVRAALEAAGVDHERAMAEAARQVAKVLKTDVPAGLIVEDGDEVPPGTVDRAVAAFHEALDGRMGAAGIETDMPLTRMDEVPEPQPEPVPTDVESIEHRFLGDVPEDFEPSKEAWQTALTLLATCNGNVQRAWEASKLLARSTGDQDLYVEVNHMLTQTFNLQKVFLANA